MARPRSSSHRGEQNYHTPPDLLDAAWLGIQRRPFDFGADARSTVATAFQNIRRRRGPVSSSARPSRGTEGRAMWAGVAITRGPIRRRQWE
jgi:hypothetical protein